MILPLTRDLYTGHLPVGWQHIEVGDYVKTDTPGAWGYVVRYFNSTHRHSDALSVQLEVINTHGQLVTLQLAEVTEWRPATPSRAVQYPQTTEIPFS